MLTALRWHYKVFSSTIFYSYYYLSKCYIYKYFRYFIIYTTFEDVLFLSAAHKLNSQRIGTDILSRQFTWIKNRLSVFEKYKKMKFKKSCIQKRMVISFGIVTSHLAPPLLASLYFSPCQHPLHLYLCQQNCGVSCLNIQTGYERCLLSG